MNENTSDVSKNGENSGSTPKKERELPDWMLDKTTVNELKFCKLFTQKHPM